LRVGLGIILALALALALALTLAITLTLTLTLALALALALTRTLSQVFEEWCRVGGAPARAARGRAEPGMVVVALGSRPSRV